MIENELINLWKGSDENIRINIGKIVDTYRLEKNISKFDKILAFRNLREYTAGILVAIVFTGYLIYLNLTPIAKAGAVLIILHSFYYVWRIWNTRNKKNNISNNESILRELTEIRAYYEQEMILLKSILYWAILPIIPGFILFYIGTHSSFTLINVGRDIIIILSIFVVIWWLNQNAAKKKFLPLIKDIDDKIKEWENIKD